MNYTGCPMKVNFLTTHSFFGYLIPYISDRMSLALAFKIKIVLLMGKFQSLTTVKRKLYIFERFTEIGTVEDLVGLRLLQKRQSKKFVKLNEDKVFEQ